MFCIYSTTPHFLFRQTQIITTPHTGDGMGDGTRGEIIDLVEDHLELPGAGAACTSTASATSEHQGL